MRLLRKSIAGLGLVTATLLATGAQATGAQATVINFDDLANGDLVTTQYAEATFSSNIDIDVIITAQDLGSSLPNFICTGAGSIDCTHDLFVDFTKPVNGLTFLATGANDLGVIAQVRVLVAGSLAGTVDILGSATPLTPVLVDLSAFSNVSGIEIFNVTDAAGLGYDDFSFTAAGIPEPGTWGLMLLGFGLVGWAARRRTALA